MGLLFTSSFTVLDDNVNYNKNPQIEVDFRTLYILCFLNIYQNNDIIWSRFPPTSGKNTPTSASSDWLKWGPYVVYTHLAWVPAWSS